MLLWKLSPEDKADAVWEQWDPVNIFVQAGSDGEARALAAKAMHRNKSPSRLEIKHLNPWTSFHFKNINSPTGCKLATEAERSEVGIVEVGEVRVIKIFGPN